jgi:hypothetical protein
MEEGLIDAPPLSNCPRACGGGGETVPTSGWVEGDPAADANQIPIAPGTPEGEYRSEVRLSNAANSQRVVLIDREGEVPGDNVLLETSVRIVRP